MIMLMKMIIMVAGIDLKKNKLLLLTFQSLSLQAPLIILLPSCLNNKAMLDFGGTSDKSLKTFDIFCNFKRKTVMCRDT